MMLAGMIGLWFAKSDMVDAEPKLSKTDIQQQLSDQYPGTISELELDYESGKVYEAEIEIKDKDYEIKVDGDTGEVIRLDEKQKYASGDQVKTEGRNSATEADLLFIREKEEKNQEEEVTKPDVSASAKHGKHEQTTKKEAIISYSEAKDIALAEFSGTIEDIELDEDDDLLRYEIEIENGESEADIEIDAYTGNILVIEIDN